MGQSRSHKLRDNFTRKTMLIVLMGAMVFAGVAVLVIAISGVTDALVTSQQAQQDPVRELVAAKVRWGRRSFTHYRLVSEIISNNPAVGFGCRQDLEIQAEHVIHVFRNDCPDWSDGLTVTDIFQLFYADPQVAYFLPTLPPGIPPRTPYVPRPTPTGLRPCQSVLVATFDPALGYPNSIGTQMQGGDCYMLGDPPAYQVKILSLTPLPTLNAWQITPPPPSPTSPTSIPPTPTPLTATQPLIISGTSYPVPTDLNPRCIANGQTGDNTVEYNVNVPDGWVVIWDSWQAYWPGGQYEDGGVLTVTGPWEGTVKIVNGQYCAFPGEWADFRPNGPLTAVPISKHCFVGAVENSQCANK